MADYTVEIGTSVSDGGSGSVTPAIPGGGSAGKLLIAVFGGNTLYTIDDDPTAEGFTLIDDGDTATNLTPMVYYKISTGSDTDPSWSHTNNGHQGYVLAVTSTTGWPANPVAGYTQTTSAGNKSGTYYPAHTQIAAGNFYLQVSHGTRNTTGETVTSVNVTSGWSAAGFNARDNVLGGCYLCSQWQKSAGNASLNQETLQPVGSVTWGNTGALTIEFAPSPAATIDSGPTIGKKTDSQVTFSTTASLP